MKMLMDMELWFFDETHIKIHCKGNGLKLMKRRFTFFEENYRRHWKFKKGMWSGKNCLYNFEEQLFPVGLLPELIRFAQKDNVSYEFMFDVSKLKSKIVDTSKANEIIRRIDEKYPMQLSLIDYQRESILKGITRKRGIFQIATSGGKSLIVYYLLQYLRIIKGSILMIVPTVNLVEQMYKDFKSYGWHDVDKYVTKLYSGCMPDMSKKILISTYQSLGKHFDEEFYHRFEAVVIDEVHTAKNETIQFILKHLKNADHRLGLTGTMPVEEISKKRVEGYLGPVLVREKTASLIERGIVSKIKIKNIILKYPEEFCKKNKNRLFADEVKLIINHRQRNLVALQNIFKEIPRKNNSLILCQHIEHLELIKKILEENFPEKSLKVIEGSTKTHIREEIRLDLEGEEGTIVIGTFGTISAGFSAKKIHDVIFMSSYKTPIKVLQSIGRGLRKHDTKEYMTLYDVTDDMTYGDPSKDNRDNHVFRHWKQRQSIYSSEGFPKTTCKIEL